MRGHFQRGGGVTHRDHIGRFVIVLFSLSVMLFSTRPDGDWIRPHGGWNVTLSAMQHTQRGGRANSGPTRIQAAEKTGRTKSEVKRFTGRARNEDYDYTAQSGRMREPVADRDEYRGAGCENTLNLPGCMSVRRGAGFLATTAGTLVFDSPGRGHHGLEETMPEHR